MITAVELRKHYRGVRAVDGISFAAEPGRVTGFLGPNGAGKSTTMRLAMGLDSPTSGQITVNGRPLAEHRAPLRQAGAVLDSGNAHPGRTAHSHLRILAATHAIPARRVREVIELTGLEAVQGRRIRSFSLGMRQRLGIAAALLGDPAVVVLDEPVNGLDPEGVRWVRQLVRRLAAEGRTVLLSSHLMSEITQVADHLIILGCGRILADAPIQDLLEAAGETRVLVRSERSSELMNALSGDGVVLTSRDAETFEVTGLDARTVGRCAQQIGAVLHELTPLRTTLEESYLTLTREETQHRSGGIELSPEEAGFALEEDPAEEGPAPCLDTGPAARPGETAWDGGAR